MKNVLDSVLEKIKEQVDEIVQCATPQHLMVNPEILAIASALNVDKKFYEDEKNGR